MQLVYVLKITLISLLLTLSPLLSKENKIYTDVPSTLIQPINGTWKASISSNDINGCPSMMKSMLSKQSLPTKSKAMTFDKPFHPASLFDEAKDLKWENIGINKWKAVMIQAQGTLNMSITWNLAINAENKMAVHSVISIDFPAEMLAMLGGSGQCSVNTLGNFNLIK